MSDKPETLDAILAEMRDFSKPLRVGGDLCSNVALPATISIWADRIEAAAEREREAYCDLCKEKDETIDRLLVERDKAIKERAPGNAAALREALQNLCDCTSCDWACIGRTGFDPLNESCLRCTGRPDRDDDCPWKMARAALAAPARNADRFATAEEAVAAFADHLRAWENAHGICSEYPDHPVRVPAGAFAWLFAEAEGADHA